MNIFVIWLVMVTAWNFGYPQASPLEDVIVEAQVHLVFINKEGKPVKIPEDIYSKFKPYFCDTIKV